eukprot:m.265443 g.265443  ORF g.265443 m.265443 type:complete len:184 (-) comp19262_c0_seq3:9-560(-)
MILPVIPTASDTCTGKPVEPLNFWQYRSLHRVKASLLAVNLASFPRATIAYLYLFEREQTFDPLTRPREPLRLTFLGLVDFVLPSLPTTGPHLWVQALLLLRLLIAAHAFKWFNTNFWARWGWHDATGAPDLGWRGLGACQKDQQRRYYRFMGRLIGLAVVNQLPLCVDTTVPLLACTCPHGQ